MDDNQASYEKLGYTVTNSPISQPSNPQTIPPTNGTQTAPTPTTTAAPAATTTTTTDAPATTVVNDEPTFSSAEPQPITTPDFSFDHVVDKDNKPYSVKDIFKLEADIDAKNIYERVTRYEELNNSLNTLKTDYEKLKAVNPYANDMVKELNDAIQKGVSHETFFQVHGVDSEKLTPTERIIKQVMWENNIDENKAKLLVEDKYKLGLTEKKEIEITEEMTPDQKLSAELQNQNIKSHNELIKGQKDIAQVQMDIDAKKATDFLKQFKKEALNPPTVEDNSQKIRETLAPVIKQIASQRGKFTLGNFNYDTPADTLDSVQQGVLDTIIKVGADNPALQTHEAIAAMTESSWWAQNGRTVAKGIYAHFASELLKYKNNPPNKSGDASMKQAEAPVIQNGVSPREAVNMGY